MRLGIDLDGCGFRQVDDYRNFLVDELGRDPAELPPATKWNYFEDWGQTAEEFWVLLQQGAESGHLYRSLPPYPGFALALKLLRQSGHQVVIATDRGRFGPGLVAATADWLAEYEVEYDGLYFGKDKTIVDVDLFVEDSPDNIAALRAAGTPTVRVNHPYNDHVESDYELSVWGELFGIVKHRAQVVYDLRVGPSDAEVDVAMAEFKGRPGG